MCNEYRIISLMSHVMTIFLKTIHNRMYKKVEENISNTQFCFRNGFGTHDVLFGYQVLLQRYGDMNRCTHICFIDYKKGFDRVQHNKLISILSSIGLDSNDLIIIKNLYWQQSARVQVDQELPDDIDIMRGLREGCILSPLLSNIYAEALEDTKESILVNSHAIN